MRGHESKQTVQKQTVQNHRNDGTEEKQKRGEDTNPLHARRGKPWSKRKKRRGQMRSRSGNRIRRGIREADAGQSVEETAMKTKVNVEELERTLDFETVGKKLLNFAESGGFRRRKTATKRAAGSKPLGEANPQLKPQSETKQEVKPVQSWIEERRAENTPAGRDAFAPRLRGPSIADPKNL